MRQPSAPFPGVRAKLILYFVLLVVIVAAVSIYVITRLVAVSAQERFDNQLREASRRGGDAVVRLERQHLDQLHNMALTSGVWEAYANHDATALQNLLAPTALNTDLQAVSAVGLDGQDLLTLYRQPGSQQLSVSSGANYASLGSVAAALGGQSDNVGDKFSELAAFPSGAYLLTSAPVRDQNDTLVGVMLVGTRLDVLLSNMKAQTAADIVVLGRDGKVVAATLDAPDSGYDVLAVPAEQIPQPGSSFSRDVQLYNRGYRVLYAPLMVRQSSVGVLGVVLPDDYVVSNLTNQRNFWLALFVIGTLLIMIVGYSLAQSIAQPVLRLRQVAQSAAQGDLTQRTGLAPRDELGEVGQALDDLVERLRGAEADSVQMRAEVERQRQALADDALRLETVRRRLEKVERLATVGALAAGVVSDVKTPLAVIQDLANNALERRQPDEPLRRDLKAMRDSAQTANTLVGELLAYAQQSPLELEQRDLRQTAAGAVQLTRYLARVSGVELNVNLPDEPVLIEHDPRQIEHVLVNLILNGLQAMPSGGTLTVQVRGLDHGALATVQDTGPGLRPEDMSGLFDPFVTTRPAGQDAGLGLTVSRGIIAAHHGRVDVASRDGEGSIFSVWLPGPQPAAVEPELTVATAP